MMEKIFMAATFSLHEYFPSRWKACNRCTKIAACISNSCTWNHV